MASYGFRGEKPPADYMGQTMDVEGGGRSGGPRALWSGRQACDGEMGRERGCRDPPLPTVGEASQWTSRAG